MKIIEKLKLTKRVIFILLASIFFLAFFLRVLFLPKLALTFHYDMARDAFNVLQIVGGHLKILGPPASTPGLFHGVFYYYLLAPAYFLGHGSPLVAAYWIAFLSAGAAILIFYLAYKLTSKISISLLAAFLFATSFEATQYGAWLSNPTLGVWTVPLMYLGLWLWLKDKNKWGPVLAALGLGLSIQADIFLAYQFVPLIFWLFVERKRLEKKEILTFLGIFLLSISSMLLAEVKFGFKGIVGIQNLLTSEDVFVKFRGLGDFIVIYLNQLGKVFSANLLPSNSGWGGLLGIGFFVYLINEIKKSGEEFKIGWRSFLATYILSHLPVVSFGGVSTPFLTVGLGGAVIILTAVVINDLWKRNKTIVVGILALIILSNISTILKENSKGQTTLAIQKDLVLSKEIAAIDYSYQAAGGKKFALNSFTSPLYINTTWSYLYNWYGKTKYGYLPQWYGRDQIDLLGNNLEAVSKDTNVYVLIIEPLQGIPEKFLTEEIGFENSITKLVEEKSFGDIKVQIREKLH